MEIVKSDKEMRKQSDIRKEANKILVARLKAGDPLKSPIDHVDTWWPPRPLTQKDKKDIAKVYNLKEEYNE